MNYIMILRGLGVLSICTAAVSFLLEGWSTFNGLERYLAFAGFFACIFSMGEFFKRTSSTVAEIFSSLTLAMSGAMAAQLGSFVYDKFSTVSVVSDIFPSPLPEGAPLELICVISFLLLVSMIWRSLRMLGASRPLLDLIYFVGAAALFIIPIRTSLFHAQALMTLFLSFLVMDRVKAQYSINSMVMNAVKFSPFLLLAGRACFYEQETSLYVLFDLVAILTCSSFLIPRITNKDGRQALFIISYILLFVLVGHLSEYKFWTEFYMTLTVASVGVALFALRYKEAAKLGLFLINLCAWLNLILMVVASRFDFTFVALNLAFPVVIAILSCLVRFGFSFASALALFACTLSYLFHTFVKLPVVNLWMVFGLVGIVLLVASSLIEKPHHKFLEKWKAAMEYFN